MDLEGELEDARAELESLHAERTRQSQHGAYSMVQSMQHELLRDETKRANLQIIYT